MSFDPRAIRADFPILEREVNGKPLVYLDNAASSQKPRAVVEAMTRYYYESHANVHRGAHALSAEATELYEGARAKVARFLNAPSEREVVFVRNATEGLNLMARAWGDAFVRAGDRIVVTEAEHHAGLVPWHLLAERVGAEVVGVRLGDDGRLDLDHLRELTAGGARVVAVQHMSNVLGIVHPVAEICAVARDAGALSVIDGAQAAPHLPVDVQALGCDAYAVSGHKMMGPTGAGALWARMEVLEATPPFLGGGEMIRKVELDRSTYAAPPMRFEAGTPAIAEAIGLGAAVDYLEALGMGEVWEHDRALARYALERLRGMDGVTLYGPEGDDRGGVVAFRVAGAHPHDVASALDQEGVAVRAGNHCAQPLMKVLGAQGTVRASFYAYTTEDEIDRFVEALARTRDFFADFA